MTRERGIPRGLHEAIEAAWARNGFYREKWRQGSAPRRTPRTAEEFQDYPLTERAELVADQRHSRQPNGTCRSVAGERFVRVHRTSGTTGATLWWADTSAGWEHVVASSAELFSIAGIARGDRIIVDAAFGASLGPWILLEGAARAGALAFAGGWPHEEPRAAVPELWRPTAIAGMPSRLLALRDSLAARSARAAVRGVERLILSGEPVPDTVRACLEDLWGVEVFDRYGLTEIGPVAAECEAHPGGLHVLDSGLWLETVDPATGRPLPDGDKGEIVATSFGRTGSELFRYRTGDLGTLSEVNRCRCGRSGCFLVGGVVRIQSKHRRRAREDHEPERSLAEVRARAAGGHAAARGPGVPSSRRP